MKTAIDWWMAGRIGGILGHRWEMEEVEEAMEDEEVGLGVGGGEVVEVVVVGMGGDDARCESRLCEGSI